MAKQPILKELEYFVNGATAASTINPSGLSHLVHCAFNLLHNLPASKDAVFEYFTIFFDASVAGYVKLMEVSQMMLSDDKYTWTQTFIIRPLITQKHFTFCDLLFSYFCGSKRIQIWSHRMTIQLQKCKMFWKH